MSFRVCIPISTTRNIKVKNSNKVNEHKALWEHAVNGSIFIGEHQNKTKIRIYMHFLNVAGLVWGHPPGPPWWRWLLNDTHHVVQFVVQLIILLFCSAPVSHPPNYFLCVAVCIGSVSSHIPVNLHTDEAQTRWPSRWSQWNLTGLFFTPSHCFHHVLQPRGTLLYNPHMCTLPCFGSIIEGSLNVGANVFSVFMKSSV